MAKVKIKKTKTTRWYSGGIKLYKSVIAIENRSRDLIEVRSWGRAECDELSAFIKERVIEFYNIDKK